MSEPSPSVPVLEESRTNAQGDGNNRGNFTRNTNKEPDDAIARKMFFGGCVCLPWLHLVNIIFYRKQFLDPTVDPTVTLCTLSAAPECPYCVFCYCLRSLRVVHLAVVGVRRSFLGFSFWTVVFLTWAIIFQLKWKDFGWSSLVMVMPQSDQNAGW